MNFPQHFSHAKKDSAGDKTFSKATLKLHMSFNAFMRKDEKQSTFFKNLAA